MVKNLSDILTVGIDTMYLMAGLGADIVRESAKASDLGSSNVDTFLTLFVASLAIFMLISSVPPMIRAIITGGTSSSAFSKFAAGTALGGIANAAKSLNVAARGLGSLRGGGSSSSKALSAAQNSAVKAGQ